MRFGSHSSLPTKRGGTLLYDSGGDLFLYDLRKGKVKQLTHTQTRESNPFFGSSTDLIFYTSNNNLFLWNLTDRTLTQLTYFGKSGGGGRGMRGQGSQNKVARFYSDEEKKLFPEFAKKPKKREFTRRLSLKLKGSERISFMYVTPDRDYIVFLKSSFRMGGGKRTKIPHFVDRSGYTKITNARSKAAEQYRGKQELYVADVRSKKVTKIALPKKDLNLRAVLASPSGNQFVVSAPSSNRKDGYLLHFTLKDKEAKVIHHVNNKAWLGYLTFSSLGWIDSQWFYFTSEEDGHNHIYKINPQSGKKLQLTEGKFVVSHVQLSPNKKLFFFTANMSHPGNKNLYRIGTSGRGLRRLTPLEGQNETTISPDFKYVAIRHSRTNRPWSLYLTRMGKRPKKIKDFAAGTFTKHQWSVPEIVTFKAGDGTVVYSRLYVPKNPLPSRPGVIFIHGAGYLQNAHFGWSSYFREYMFNCKLQEAGYYVMDVDYSGSAGYGADFRTRIYRHMGGKDLDDIVTAAKYMRAKFAVRKVGIYGGSYGGFLALMGMFTKADHFTAGAALRPVTDWAHYSNWYSGNILNNPLDDPEAYRKSSPIYFAEGLKGHLLMCHGMVDSNVHFQDSVRLAQRLIDLGKENWELAVYPLEAHSFTRAASWTDEYRRIWKLFEKTLR
jgi:dipeptidyl aminopeptidase/acylaminoacyl peptidase